MEVHKTESPCLEISGLMRLCSDKQFTGILPDVARRSSIDTSRSRPLKKRKRDQFFDEDFGL